MVKRIVQWLLFFAFLAAACAAATVWVMSANLEQTGVFATFAAFFATASGFIDRLFQDRE